LNWKKTQELVYEFEESFTRLTNKIQTANTRGDQLSWQNHRKWYLQLVRENKNTLRKLKKEIQNDADLTGILNMLEPSLVNIFNIASDTSSKWNDVSISSQTFTKFKKELDKKIKEGYDVFKRRDFGADAKLCFVLMPFAPKFKYVYTKGIKPAVKKAKLKSKRADEIFASRAIIQDIWEYINKSTLLIADLTDRNPNVFYEVGLSHALPKRLIIITQNQDDVPFDLQHIRWIKYTNNVSGRKQLSIKLLRAIKEVLK